MLLKQNTIKVFEKIAGGPQSKSRHASKLVTGSHMGGTGTHSPVGITKPKFIKR